MSAEAIKIFLETNIEYYRFCDLRIKIALEERDYENVIRIAREKISGTCPNPNNIAKWINATLYEHLLEAALQINDTDSIIEAADYGFRYAKDYKYYLLVKNNMDPADWIMQQPAYLFLLESNREYCTLAQIFREEDNESALREMLPRLYITEWLKIEDSLFEQYPALLEELFDRPVWLHLKYSHPHAFFTYDDLRDYLIRMQTRFGKPKIESLLLLLKACYPRRKKLGRVFEKVTV